MIEVVTLSSKGQLVIPKKIREKMGIKKEDKFILVYDRDSILLQKISREEAKKKIAEILRYFEKGFKEAGITREEVEREIAVHRREKSG